MVANVNRKTNVPYGVISGNNVSDLLDDVFTSGTNLTFDAVQRELTQKLRKSIVGVRDDHPIPKEDVPDYRDTVMAAVREAVRDAIDDYRHHAKDMVEDLDVDDLVDALIDPDELEITDEDGESLLSQLGDRGLWDNYQGEEESYEYEYECEHGTVKLLLDWLGGAPLFWVIESPFVTTARPCSPCVPNAGDLDTPSETGIECYCLPPDDMPDDWTGKVRLLGSEEVEDVENEECSDSLDGSAGCSNPM